MSSGISFIIPAFNEELLLPSCLQSIEAEIERWHTDVDNTTLFEIIVVDNNSTDTTPDIAIAYNVTVVFEIKKGLTHARQAGYNAAKYEYHAYIDADNELPSGWLDNISYLNDSNVVAISGPPYYKDQTTITRTSVEVFYFLTRLAHKYIGPSMQGGNFIVKKSALDLIDGHSTDIIFYGEDTDLAVRLSKIGKVILLPEMWIYSSDRRYANQGIFTTTFIYTLNYLSINFLRKPATKKYKDFRPMIGTNVE
jgi:glycosyltransferase involved in cell wall biosynthesis